MKKGQAIAHLKLRQIGRQSGVGGQLLAQFLAFELKLAGSEQETPARTDWARELVDSAIFGSKLIF